MNGGGFLSFGQDVWNSNSGSYGQVYPHFAGSAEFSTQASFACAPAQQAPDIPWTPGTQPSAFCNMFCDVPFQPSSNSNLSCGGHFHIGHGVHTYGDQMQQFSGFPRLASQRPAMPLPRPPPFLPPALSAAANADSTPTQLPAIPLPRPPRFPPPTPSAAASVKSTPTQGFAIPMPWPPHFPPPTPSAASPTSTPI
ncbi:TPA: hypothetical protein ACH3X3_009713 [Trebouxia sp. C0006]